MPKPSDGAYAFEGIKVFLRQDKNGYTMGVSIHPNEVPEPLMRDLVGQRYMFAMVPINHDDTPRITATVENSPADPYLAISATTPTRDEDAGSVAVRQAGILCRDPEFWRWIGAENEDQAVARLHKETGVDSRKEYKDNAQARKRFGEIHSDYKLWST